MPPEDWFTFRENDKLCKDCLERWNNADEKTEIKFCQIGLDKKNPPSYFLYGDSIAYVLTNVFRDFEPPGMHVALNGHFCSPLHRPPGAPPQKIYNKFACDRLINAVYEYIKATPSIKTLFISSAFSRWPEVTAQRFNLTLSLFRALNVHITIIQQPPVQREHDANMWYYYSKLVGQGQLTDGHLKSISVTRQEYNKQQAEFIGFFTKYNHTRDVTLIRIDDLVCDVDVCLIGTGTRPYWKDTMHMTWIGAERLASRLRKYVSY
jgi:hypothetical protein